MIKILPSKFYQILSNRNQTCINIYYILYIYNCNKEEFNYKTLKLKWDWKSARLSAI